MLNNIVNPDKTTFGIFNCEQLFRDVWDGYFADAMDEKWIAARVEQAVESAKANTRPFGPCVSINVYRKKRVVAGARNQHYLQLWRPAA